ncbi:MAG TPA: DUF485 domain-containing protein [Arachnia sp.]|nr:DUF485 domain-containing protein [Arachnia sp.]HMT87728.1 DUF485 domain-containing protein [Arachnia sp.]
MAQSTSPQRVIPPEAYKEVRDSAQFIELKRVFRGFAFPMTAAFLGWYIFYVLGSVFARDIMATPYIGKLNVGLTLGLLQFVTTFLITWLYMRHMTKNVDPIATEIREKLEEQAQ